MSDNNEQKVKIKKPSLWNKYHKAVATSIYSDGKNGFNGYPQAATKCLEIHKEHLTKSLMKAIKDGVFEGANQYSDDMVKLYVNELMDTYLI